METPGRCCSLKPVLFMCSICEVDLDHNVTSVVFERAHARAVPKAPEPITDIFKILHLFGPIQ